MRTSLRVLLALTVPLAATACRKIPVAPTPSASASRAPAPGAERAAKPATTRAATRDAGEAGIGITGPDADRAPPSGPIYFEFDSATLTLESRELLARLASWLEQHPSRLRIEGHTDERGTTEYNLALGDRRARAIAEYLAALGIDPAGFEVVSYGEERPLVAGHDEEAWRENRRGDVRTE